MQRLPKTRNSVFVAIDIPDQALSLDSYSINSKTGKPDLKSVTCPVIYGTKASGNDIKLYRIGTDINERGYYMPSRSSTTLILDNISQNSKRPLKCPSGKWKAVKRGGIEVCIDQRSNVWPKSLWPSIMGEIYLGQRRKEFNAKARGSNDRNFS